MPYIDSGSVSIYYQVQGEGYPLFLIHGLGSSSRDWELQLPVFSQYFQVITLDLRGHGRSDKPPGPYQMALFASDTVNVIEELGFSSVYVLGLSLGGMVAFQLALDFPHLTQGLVIVNSTPELLTNKVMDKFRLWQRLFIIRLMGMEKMGQVLAHRFFTKPEQEEIRKLFIKRWSENHKPSYLESLKAANGWSVRERLPEIQAPTLIIGADGDYFPQEDKEAYTKLIPGAELLIINDSKHALPAEKPDEFNQAVIKYLTSLPSSLR
jgi:pimeloyl-ACP methyl ester carboxylesterase